MNAAPTRKSFAGKGVYPVSQAGWLLTPLRRLVMSPRRMMERLALKPGEQVLEVGPGPGWFSPEIAKLIAPGRLALFDIQREMLQLATARLKRAGLDNFDCSEGDAVSLPFADGQFDAVVFVTVLGEVSDPGHALREATRVLRPSGRILVAEQMGDPDRVRPALLEKLAGEAGLKIVRSEGSRLLYSVVLQLASKDRK